MISSLFLLLLLCVVVCCMNLVWYVGVGYCFRFFDVGLMYLVLVLRCFAARIVYCLVGICLACCVVVGFSCWFESSCLGFGL